MQEQYLFEYAVIRVMPRVEREEFLNTGIILYCKKKNFLHVLFELNTQKLAVICGECDLEELNNHLIALASIASGTESAGPIAQLPISERFRWLTAQRSTMLQTSKVHPGFCNDPLEMIQQLFQQLVL